MARSQEIFQIEYRHYELVNYGAEGNRTWPPKLISADHYTPVVHDGYIIYIYIMSYT